MTNRLVGRVCIAVLTVSVLAAGIAVAAGEDRIFPVSSANCQEVNTQFNGSVCLPDSSGHTVYVNGLGPKLKTASQWTLNNSYDTVSPINILFVDPPVTGGPTETDIYYRSRNDLPDFVFAFAGCNDNSVSGTVSRCDQFYVTYHGDWICSNATWCNTASIHNSLACHETGHTFGLMHPDASSPARAQNQVDYYCMRNDYGAFASMYLGGENVFALQSVQYPAGDQ